MLKYGHEIPKKESIISQNFDFGKEWLGWACSEEYFEEVKPIFDYLLKLKAEGKYWKEIKDKGNKVYVPFLNAFIKEFCNINKEHNAAGAIIKFLISDDNRTQQPSANKHTRVKNNPKLDGVEIKPKKLPEQILELDFKERSKNTVVLTMDKGWSLSFRIHNASTKVEPSLKFDIQLQSRPVYLLYVNALW